MKAFGGTLAAVLRKQRCLKNKITLSKQCKQDRIFLNLWFGKRMVCLRVAFHENDGNHENDENNEDDSDS